MPGLLLRHLQWPWQMRHHRSAGDSKHGGGLVRYSLQWLMLNGYDKLSQGGMHCQAGHPQQLTHSKRAALLPGLP